MQKTSTMCSWNIQTLYMYWLPMLVVTEPPSSWYLATRHGKLHIFRSTVHPYLCWSMDERHPFGKGNNSETIISIHTTPLRILERFSISPVHSWCALRCINCTVSWLPPIAIEQLPFYHPTQIVRFERAKRKEMNMLRQVRSKRFLTPPSQVLLAALSNERIMLRSAPYQPSCNLFASCRSNR